jgi:hypothetical protein
MDEARKKYRTNLKQGKKSITEEEISDRKRKRAVQGKKEELGGWAEVSEHERFH